MNSAYRHTEISFTVVILFGLGIFIVTFFLLYLGFSWLGLISLLLLDAGMVMFSTITEEIHSDVLDVRLGPGPLHRSFPLSETTSCSVGNVDTVPPEVVRTMPLAWLYRKGKQAAVDLVMKTGIHYRIETDEPELLAANLQRMLPHGA